ncbi:MAG: hypothetical protein IBJ07_12335 [Rhizobiaceae bacterium]|nr:hypothetical protein [Rhizobiaceae bacterium]
MACYIETGHSGRVFPAVGPAPVELVSGAFGVKLHGSFDALTVSSDECGWLHVSREQKDKAAVGKSRRVFAGQHRELAGIGGGMFVSFIADGHGFPPED